MWFLFTGEIAGSGEFLEKVGLSFQHRFPLPNRNQLIFLYLNLCLYKLKKALATYTQKNVLINNEVMSEKHYIKQSIIIFYWN